MRQFKAGYEILTPISKGAVEELKKIEEIARVCYKSEDKITKDSYKYLIKNLIDRGHEAMLEHSTLSVKFICDRGVSHELVRHRIASFAQESTRYCNYGNEKHGGEINVVDLEQGMRILNYEDKKTFDLLDVWMDAMIYAEKCYLKMIELGASPQIARSVLPNSTKTEIVITANYREWRNIFKLRTAGSAHPQMREIMIPLLSDVYSRIPIIFDDIYEDKVIPELMKELDNAKNPSVEETL